MKQYENIPEELKLLPQWVCHRDKKPFNPITGKAAKAGQPGTWVAFAKAVKASERYDGIGFEFNNNGIIGIDLDKVIAEDGTLLSEAAEVVSLLDSYTEISPSGRGLHIFVRGDIPASGRRKGFIEVYKAGRYFTMTGNTYGTVKPINERTGQLKLLWDKYFGEKEKAFTAPVSNADAPSPTIDYLAIGLTRDARFKKMWNGEYESERCISESEKDLALMGRLLYWCSGDVERAVDAFMALPHVAMKDIKHTGKLNRDDYMNITIKRALKGLTSTAHEDDERYRQEQGFTLDDMGNAKRLVDLYGSSIRFSYIKNSWYSLTGNTGEECLFILYGIGRNGKGTFAETLLHLLGSYGKTAQVDSLMLKSAAGSCANPDIARLKGARFVNAAEPQKNAKLNESLVKQLTGGDTVTARFLYGREFEYRPEFKLWINTNYKPQISGNDDGIWSRVRLLPFTVYIPPEKRDLNLKAYLREKELDGILAWAVEGCMLWQKEGLGMPEPVNAATEDYRFEMDVMQRFLNDCTKPNSGAFVGAYTPYKAYVDWCSSNGEYILSNTKFGRDVSRYLNKRCDRNGTFYFGVELTKPLKDARDDFEDDLFK